MKTRRGLLVSMALGTALWADFTMVYRMDDGTDGVRDEVIQYKNAAYAKLFFRKPEDANKTIEEGEYIIDGVRYSVLREEGKLTYMNLEKVEKATERLEKEMNISCVPESGKPPIKPFFTFLEKVGTKRIRGIEGEVWKVVSEEDGERYHEEIVITNDEKIVKAMKISMKILRDFGEGPYGMEIDDALLSMMLVKEGYVLLSAKGMTFIHYDEKPIDSAVFKLPEGAVDGIANLPEMDKEKKDAGKRLLKEMLE
jgi:hypothetical protein